MTQASGYHLRLAWSGSPSVNLPPWSSLTECPWLPLSLTKHSPHSIPIRILAGPHTSKIPSRREGSSAGSSRSAGRRKSARGSRTRSSGSTILAKCLLTLASDLVWVIPVAPLLAESGGQSGPHGLDYPKPSRATELMFLCLRVLRSDREGPRYRQSLGGSGQPSWHELEICRVRVNI